MPAEWYYYQNDTRYGPVETEQIHRLVGSGQLKASDLVWRNGMSGWSPILSVPELAPTTPVQRFDEPAAYGEPPPYRGPAAPPYAPALRQPRSPALGLGQILLLAGAGLCFINFFMPWWGLSAREQKTPEDNPRTRDVARVMQPNAEWYLRRLGPETFNKIEEVYTVPGVTRYSRTIMGWSTGAGIMGFIFSFVVIAPIIVAIFVVFFRSWVWIASFGSAIFGLILLIFAMLWLFGSPGADVPGLFSQGNIVGPWFCLIGSLLLLAGGILDGIFGVLRLIGGGRRDYVPAAY